MPGRCTWTATSNANWLTITAGSSGAGNSTVAFAVAANTLGPRTGLLTIGTQTFTVRQAGVATPRLIRVNATSAALGSSGVPVAVELVAQGDENALGFTLSFDPAVLSNPQAALGADAVGAQLAANTNQTAQGRLGLAVALPAGQKFAAGTRQLAVVTFSIAAAAPAAMTMLDFDDLPSAREVSDVSANALPASYQGGALGVVPGVEGDVAPRPQGNGSVTITDWVQVGRLVAGLDAAAPGVEFQRADCAPRDTCGDGRLTVSDWTQAGRYAIGTDAALAAGGPAVAAVNSSLAAGVQSTGFSRNGRTATQPPKGGTLNTRALRTVWLTNATQQTRTVRVVNATAAQGATASVAIELTAQGNENAVGFSLSFNPAVLSNPQAVLGSGATGTTLNLNTNQAGRVGVAMAQSPGVAFTAGTRQLLVVTFNVASGAAVGTTALSFGDQPIAREVSGVSATPLPADFTAGAVTVVGAVANVSAASFTGAQLASEAIVSAFGTRLATTTQSATVTPLPTTLAGTRVLVRDSAGTERAAPLFFVSPQQLNYLVPAGTVAGTATISITSGDGSLSLGVATMATIAPGLFTANANGQGVPAAVALRVRGDGAQAFETVAQFVAGRFIPAPIDLGPEGEQVILLLFGTGVRGRSALAAVTCVLGGISVPVSFAGAQGDLAGLDQLNVGPLPRALAGRGEVDLVLTVDGRAANAVRVSFR
ncbi:MAG: hypothetical protein HYR56_17630 [Acidobacteria bacterium]|nr:hypothetical protein [Acidobacteriota bacterium]MBI3426528.1 hypothetical protein [Acidobacteriota bacterium]